MTTPADALDIQADPETRPARTRRPIERSSYVAIDDAFAPAPEGARCRSRYITRFGVFANGYMRREHSLDKDGCCIHCGAVPAMAAGNFRKGR